MANSRSWLLVGAGLVGCVLIVFSLALNIFQNQRRIDALQRDLAEVRALAESINADRHKRTVIIQGFIEQIGDHEARLAVIEQKRKP